MKVIRTADQLAREHTEAAIGVLADCMESHDPRIALEAAKALLERGHGKPAQAIIALPASKRMQQQLNSLTDDELLEAINAEYQELPALPPPSPSETIDPLLQ